MDEPWTILELAELAADALAAAPPTASSAEAGPPDGAGSSGGAGSTGGPETSGETGSSGGAGLAAGRRAGSSSGGGMASGAARPAPVRANGRVRDVPNERLVRWYVTVGLVDPPLSRRGRVARYGRRHLLQLVAVKRRQAEGRSLAEIQAELAGATDEALAAVARVPDTQPTPDVLPAAQARFWTRSAAQRGPAAAEEAGKRSPAAEEAGKRSPAVEEAGKRSPAAEEAGARYLVAAAGAGRALSAADGDAVDRGPSRLVRGVRLASGVTLLLEGAAREPG